MGIPAMNRKTTNVILILVNLPRFEIRLSQGRRRLVKRAWPPFYNHNPLDFCGETSVLFPCLITHCQEHIFSWLASNERERGEKTHLIDMNGMERLRPGWIHLTNWAIMAMAHEKTHYQMRNRQKESQHSLSSCQCDLKGHTEEGKS